MTVFMGVLYILLTIAVYYAMKKLYIKFYVPFLLPIVTSTTIIISMLLFSNTSYAAYMEGARWIVHLLSPAVVALALPLYRQWDKVKLYFLPLLVGILTGSIVGIISGMQLAKLLKVDDIVTLSLIPKSVTSPIAMEIATILGGNPTLAAAFVMIAGITGGALGPLLIKLFRIEHFIGRGIGFGSSAHAIGTARALEMGEKEGAVSSVAMNVSAIVATILCPLLAAWLL